jgi:hypothetical protein
MQNNAKLLGLRTLLLLLLLLLPAALPLHSFCVASDTRAGC